MTLCYEDGVAHPARVFIVLNHPDKTPAECVLERFDGGVFCIPFSVLQTVACGF